MAKDKKGFQLYTDQRDIIQDCSLEEKGLVLDWIFSYVNDENPEIPKDRYLKNVIEQFKKTFKRDLLKWEEKCRKNSINGLKGGRPKGSVKKNPKNPTVNLAFKKNPTKPKKADTDNDTDIDNDNDIVKRKKKNIKKIEVPVLVDTEKYELLKEWVQYKKDLGDTIKTNQGMNRIANKFEKNNNLLIRREMDNSMANGWKDIFYTNNKNTGGNLAKDIVASKLKELLPEPPQPKDGNYDTPEGREYIKIFKHNQEARRWNTKNVYKG